MKSAILLAAASITISACTADRTTAPRPPAEYEVVAQTYREGFSSNPTTAAMVRETATGCLFSVAEGKGAAPVLLPNGAHAGCRS